MPPMFWVILREVLILLACLALFPAVVVLLLVYSDSLPTGLMYLRKQLAAGGWGPGGTPLVLWLKMLVPYAVIQTIRAYSWSQRTLTGRRWANLYFALLLGLMGARSAYLAWDLFYFMYALGDMPKELLQFLDMEGFNVSVAVLSFLLAAYCFRVFVNPSRKLRSSDNRKSG